MIKPTIGRVVLVFQSDSQADPYPALITKIFSDAMINVAGFNDGGTPFSESSITLVQDEPAPTGRRAEWMPYQIAQTAKVEAPVAGSNTPAPITANVEGVLFDEVSQQLHKGLTDAIDHAKTMVSGITDGTAKSVASTLLGEAHDWFVKAIAAHQAARTAPPIPVSEVPPAATA